MEITMANRIFTKSPKTTGPRSLVLLFTSVLALGLAGCDKPAPDQTIGQKLDAAVAKTEVIAADVKADAAQAMDTAKAKMDAEMPKVQASVEKAGDKALAVMDDAVVTAHVSAGLVKDAELSAIKIDVDTKGGVVTLNGTAPTATAKDRATDIAKSVSGVSAVDNKLVVKGG